jgi:hypothetical protein
VLLPLLVAFNVLAPRTRLGLVWVLAGNLGVGAGYNEMRPPPVPTAIVSGPNEWLVQRVGGARVEVRFSSDFFSPESYGGHAWRWTSTGGSLGLSNPHGVPLESRVEIGLRAPSPRQVELRFDGRTVWSGTVAESLVRVDLGRQTILAEDSRLDVVTGPPDPPVGDQPPLAVAVYDVRIAIVGPAEETARELLFQGR